MTGLDAALAHADDGEVDVFTTRLAEQHFAFFITRAELLGTIELPRR